MVDEQTPLMSGGPSPVEEQSLALKKFRLAIGINTTPSALPSDFESLRKNSSGIYKDILAHARRHRIKYELVRTLYYVSLITQLVIGATLAALGSVSKLHPAAITVLGIANSCFAGILGYLKSNDLPDRLRKDTQELYNVRDFIEQWESRLAVGWDDISAKEIDDLIREVFERRDAARDTVEMNRSDNYAHPVDEDTNDNAQGNNNTGNGKGRRQSKIFVGKGKTMELS